MNNLRPRASKIGLISLCPGSHQLSASLPPEVLELKESDAATMGTTLHACMAAEDPYLHGVSLGLGDWELGMLSRATGWEDTCIQTFMAGHPSGKFHTAAEHEFPLISLDGVEEDLLPTGHADRVVWNDEHGIILDYKFGRNPLEKEILAPQLLTYAVGFLEEFPAAKAVEVVAYHTAEDAEYFEVVHRADLPAIKGRLAAIILATQEAAPLFRPGRLQCQHCPANAICPVAHREMRRLVQWVGRSLADRSPAERAELLDVAKLAKAAAESVIDAVKGQIQIAPGSVPGWRLKERSSRVIEDTPGVLGALAPWVSVEESLATARPSITRIESLFAAKYVEKEGGTKKAAKEKLETLMIPYITRETTYVLERDTNGQKALPAPEKE
jgi:CRISPR/Cas system-associated exonuclease Cas4 (RecB family)